LIEHDRDAVVLEILDRHIPKRWNGFTWSGDEMWPMLHISADDDILKFEHRDLVKALYQALSVAGYNEVSIRTPTVEV
jgi:hypothetical protein